MVQLSKFISCQSMKTIQKQTRGLSFGINEYGQQIVAGCKEPAEFAVCHCKIVSTSIILKFRQKY